MSEVEMEELDLEAFLEQLPNGTLAWMANRLADRPTGHRWASRDEAIAAALHCHAALADDDPTKDLPWRFAHTPTLAGWARRHPAPPSEA